MTRTLTLRNNLLQMAATSLCALLSACVTQQGVNVRRNGAQAVPVLVGGEFSPQTDMTAGLSPLDKVRVQIIPVTGSAGSRAFDIHDTISYDFSFVGKDYHLVPGDELTVYFGGDPRLELSLIVRPDGRLTLPKVADIPAAGRTPVELARDIDAVFRDRMNNPGSSVVVTKSNLAVEKMAGYAVVQGDGGMTIPGIGHVAAAGSTPAQLEQDLGGLASKRFGNDLEAHVSLRPSTTEERRGLAEYDQVIVVAPDGRIALPELGYFVAAGKSAAALEVSIYDALHARYKTAPAVVVTVEDSANRMVYVDGEVGRPGAYPITPAMTVLKALTVAGGVIETGDLSDVALIRRNRNNDVFVYVTNLKEFIKNGAKDNDLPLASQDIVVVAKTSVAKFDLWIDQYINRALPFSRGVSYSYNRGETSINQPNPNP